ncbi:MAG: Fe-S cluster assembly protein NifU [Candidatus Riflebacteria bacterium HGW-Riflebacteria-2]|jgi:NifU-like protein|nr:MAG: Fe-S cluster assembly protein NifU [Candidatus Riflebacteria bacterium HGW-Riflebacteria-2]
MWDYTKSVMDHFSNPRNVGKIEDADGVGEVGSLACGDALKLYLKINRETGKIEDARFQTFGCASAIASASALTELIKGMPLEEAEKVTNDDIARFLGGLPEQKMHCSVMGREALEAALANYRGIKVEEHADAQVICKCFWVDEHKLREVITENKLKTVEEVTHYTKAGGGCGGCVPDIKRILADINGPDSKPETEEKPRMTNLQRIKLVTETIEKKIAPMLRQDGGDIELIDVDGYDIYVRLRGACAGCPGAKATLQNIVAETLRREVDSNINIIEASK